MQLYQRFVFSKISYTWEYSRGSQGPNPREAIERRRRPSLEDGRLLALRLSAGGNVSAGLNLIHEVGTMRRLFGDAVEVIGLELSVQKMVERSCSFPSLFGDDCIR